MGNLVNRGRNRLHLSLIHIYTAGLTVYVLHEDNTESMVFDPQEIMDHGGLFGVDHEEWEKSPQFHEKDVYKRQLQHSIS